MDLKNGKLFTSKSVGTVPSSYEKRIYRAAVSQRLRNTDLDHIVEAYTGRNVVKIHPRMGHECPEGE